MHTVFSTDATASLHTAVALVALCSLTTLEKLIMTWQTPTACDFRFGFEITMYIANR